MLGIFAALLLQGSTQIVEFHAKDGSYSGRSVMEFHHDGTGTSKLYDRAGAYQGRTDYKNGIARSYNREGAYTGRSITDTYGVVRYYDKDGAYRGLERPSH